MKVLFRNLLVIFFLGISSKAFSSSVVILMTQHDDEIDTLKEATHLIESGVANILYDAGYIISSMPASINGENEAALKIAIENAKNGYMAYTVQIIVYYEAKNPENPAGVIFEDIQSVDWKVVRTQDGSLVYEKNIIPTKNSGEGDINAITRFSGLLGSDIQHVLYGNFEGK